MRLFSSSSVLLASAMLISAAGHSQFGPASEFQIQGPRSVNVADLDNDGQMDVVVASRGGFFIYHNSGSGNFSQPQLINSEESVATVLDVDNDGDQDLIGSVDNGGGLYMHRNINGINYGSAEPVAPGNSADMIGSADLDQDLDLDVFAITEDGALLVVYNTDGNGTFAAPMTIAQLDDMTSAQAVDIDSDGWMDMVFSSDVSSEVLVCRNDYGVFMDADQFTDSGHGTVHDLDNDGHADALTANTAAGMVRWQRNTDGDGLLDTPALVDQSFSTPQIVHTSDLDGDGDKDAIVTSSAMDEVAWYENIDGQGTFGPRQTVAFGVQASALASGDVDGDGDEDLFVASAELNKVVWYMNMANSSNMIIGRVFNDINGDGLFNGNDHGLMNMRVDASEMGSTYTNASGMYWFTATPGEYTTWMGGQENWNFTTSDEHTMFVTAVGASQDNDFGLQANGELGQLTPNLNVSAMRCSETVFYWASVTNTGNQVGDVELTVDADDLIDYINADEPPTSVNNGQLTWTFQNVQPTHHRAVRLIMQLPNSDYTGQLLHDRISARLIQDGTVTSNNTLDYHPMLLCSMDPNDKQVLPVGEGVEHLTAMGSDLNYTIRFQNTGNAVAYNVMIEDSLEADVDPESLQILGSSHTYRATIDPNGVMHFTFENINLPDSGSDFNGSQGFIRFMVKHRTGRSEGTAITNRAGIYFDMNEAVITNSTLNTLTYNLQTGLEETMFAGTNDLLVFPNPAHNMATVRLSDDFTGRINVLLLDASGRVIREVTRRSGTLVIDRGELPDGLYVVRATDELGLTRIARFEFSR